MVSYSLYGTVWLKFNTFFKSVNFFNGNIYSSIETSNFKYKFINRIIASLMGYIILINFLGLIPYNFSITSIATVNFSLSFLFFFAITINFIKNKERILTHLVPKSSPTPLIFILVIIETLRILIRPITLGLRITANIIAGHVILTIIGSGLTCINIRSIFLINFVILVNILETIVAIIQAYVIVILLNYCLKDFTE